VLIHQDASLYAAILNGDDQAGHALAAGRLGYVHVIRGQVEVNGVALKGGDAVKIGDEERISFARTEAAELLLFDLPR
jgi:redox-sensitive bicupin YhaK (pirin superfamily)